MVPAASAGSRRKSPSSMCSTVTSAVFEACAIVISSRCTPTHTLPWRVGLEGVEQRHVGADGRQDHDRIARAALGERIVDHLPVGPHAQQVGAEMPRRGMNGTPFSAACRPAWIAGQVASHISMLAGLDGGGEARRQPVLAERHGGGLHARHAAGADQHVDLEAALRHRDDVQVAHGPRISSRTPTWRSPSSRRAGRCARRSGMRAAKRFDAQDFGLQEDAVMVDSRSSCWRSSVFRMP